MDASYPPQTVDKLNKTLVDNWVRIDLNWGGRKKKPGRPKGSVKMTIQRYANNPPKVLPKTDHQRLKELKELMIRSGGKDVAQKVIDIALNDDHPGQMAALKMCIDRTLPISMFEKDKSQRSAVTINITGLGQEPIIVENTEQPEDVEAKYG